MKPANDRFNGKVTLLQKVRSIRALARGEKALLERGYDPVGAVDLIYQRAIKFYDQVFPNDEADFRQMLVDRYNRQKVRALTRPDEFA